MAEAREIGEYVTTAAGLGLECSGFAPSLVFLQTIIFTISASLAIFDTYTDWEVVFTFREDGFNNPLLRRSDDWLRAWFLFAAIGTVLTVISVVHDGIDLFYSIFKSCQKQVSKCCTKHDTANKQNQSTQGQQPSKVDSEEEITDPLKCCFRYGWNSTTRNETLSFITLWFQDVPMLAMAVLYGFSQESCKTPDPKDVTPALYDIGISATVAVVASAWRVTRSFIRVYFTVKIAGKIGEPLCMKKSSLPEPKTIKPPGKYLKKILPKPSESAYPPGTCAHKCLRFFYIGGALQLGMVLSGLFAIMLIWLSYSNLSRGKSFDDSLGIYRFSLTRPDTLLFNISGTIIPPNGSFVNLEQIPYDEQYLPLDIYCLSEFEYREKDFDIFFNAIEVIIVSSDGKFCEINGEQNSGNKCYNFYTFENFVLYYASRNPSTGDVERFDQTCVVIERIIGYVAGPKTDPNIDVGRLINRDGFPQNNEPLVIYYPTYNFYLLFSSLKDGSYVIFPSIERQNITLNCTARYSYSFRRGAVVYNYRGAVISQLGCTCSQYADLACHVLHHKNVSYGYLTEDFQRVIPYTHCSSLPSDKIVPQWDVFLSLDCPHSCVII